MVVEPDANTVTIESAVKEHINGAQVARQHGKELAFRLPSSESHKFEGKFVILIRLHIKKLVHSLFFACIYFPLNVFCATFQCDLNNGSTVCHSSLR